MVPAKVECISIQTTKGMHDTNFNHICIYKSVERQLLASISLGAYVPLTTEGNILVDGVLASCYASFNHDIQHVVMKPLVWFPSVVDLLLGEDMSLHSYVTILQHVGRMMSL